VSEPSENRRAGIIPSVMDICIAAILREPKGSEPKKDINKPVKNMRPNLDMQ
jgi:hypothetical protein